MGAKLITPFLPPPTHAGKKGYENLRSFDFVSEREKTEKGKGIGVIQV